MFCTWILPPFTTFAYFTFLCSWPKVHTSAQGHAYREVQIEYTNNTPEYAHRIHTEYVMNKSSSEYGSEYSYNTAKYSVEYEYTKAA